MEKAVLTSSCGLADTQCFWSVEVCPLSRVTVLTRGLCLLLGLCTEVDWQACVCIFSVCVLKCFSGFRTKFILLNLHTINSIMFLTYRNLSLQFYHD